MQRKLLEKKQAQSGKADNGTGAAAGTGAGGIGAAPSSPSSSSSAYGGKGSDGGGSSLESLLASRRAPGAGAGAGPSIPFGGLRVHSQKPGSVKALGAVVGGAGGECS